MPHFIVISKKSKIYWYSSQWTTFWGIFPIFFNIIKNKWHRNYSVNILFCTLQIFVKKKEMQIIKCTHFLYFSQKLQHRKPTYSPLGKVVYYVCMLYISVGNRVYYMYECVVPFRVRNRVAPPWPSVWGRT